MNKEIITDPLSPEDLWQDLKNNIKAFKTLDINQVLVLYGFSWGTHFYDGHWTELPVDVDKLEGLLLQAVEKGYGALGHDNLYISIPGFDMTYNIHGRKTCHNEKRKSFDSSILVRLSYKNPSLRFIFAKKVSRKQEVPFFNEHTGCNVNHRRNP